MSDQYAVIGNPIGHTKSPLIHGMFAEATGQDIVYTAIEGRIGQFAEDAAAFRAAGGRGMNVTAPFKLDAFAWATERSARASLAGAVNALKFDGARVLAENFDGVGLTRDVVDNLGFALHGKRVLILGAGGATRGALLPFLEQAPAELVIANRTVDKAQALAHELQAHGALRKAELLAQSMQALQGDFDIVINATASSLAGEASPVPAQVLRPGSLAYDMMYGPAAQGFLDWAAQHGAVPRDGLGMLVEQAAEAFDWWRGVRPDTAAVIAKLTVPLC